MSSEEPLVCKYANMGSVLSEKLKKIIKNRRVTEDSKIPAGTLLDLKGFFSKIRDAKKGTMDYPNPRAFREIADEAFRRAEIVLTEEQAYTKLMEMDKLLREFGLVNGALGPRKISIATIAQKFFEQIKLMGDSASYSHFMEESHRHMPSFSRKAF